MTSNRAQSWPTAARLSPSNGALLLVEVSTRRAKTFPSFGKFIDIVMLSLTGGRERTEAEYAALLSSTGFRLNRVLPVNSQFCVIEAVPVKPALIDSRA